MVVHFVDIPAFSIRKNSYKNFMTKIRMDFVS